MAEWHLVTGEYPPRPGGVSDYTFLVAQGFANAGDAVHVWTPPADAPGPETTGVQVHRGFGGFSRAGLARLGAEWDRFPAPRRVLVQWVPHSFGYRSLNLPFCLWLLSRAALHGDRVDIMVHEPSLGFVRGSWRHNAAALVHRAMTAVLLRAARRVWVAAPQWEARWRPYTLGRRVPFSWLPIPSNVPVVEDASGICAVRARFAPAQGVLLGHFGTYGEAMAELLFDALPPLLAADGRAVLLMGRGSEAFAADLRRRHPGLAGRVHATGGLRPERLSPHLLACDLLLQPYPEGVNARRGSFMAGLSHGRPIATTAGSATEPFWAQSGAVALAPAGDTAALVACVEALASQPGRRRAVGEAAATLYDLWFDVRHTVAALRGAAREGG